MKTEFTLRHKQILKVLHEPVTSLLARHSISFKKNGEWYNIGECPWCGHGHDGAGNGQCGIAETDGRNGLVHSVKCFHAHDSRTGDDKPHYADFLVSLGELTEAEAQWVHSLKGTLPPLTQLMPFRKKKETKEKNVLRPIGKQSHTKLKRRLQRNKGALDWLQKERGFTLETIEHFGLGLGDPYSKDGKLIIENALVAPLLSHDGFFKGKYINYSIPGITIDNRDKKIKAWSPGKQARCYYSDKSEGKAQLFICDGAKDLWALWQLIQGTSLAENLLMVSSTNGGGSFPQEWYNPSYWDRWEHVYLGHDNDKPNDKGVRAGECHALKLAEVAIREMLRVHPPIQPPIGKDWNDWMLAGGSVEEFENLLRDAEIMIPDDLREIQPAADDDLKKAGRFAYKPLSINGAFHNSRLYHTASTIVRGYEPVEDEQGNMQLEMHERQEVVVVRSDRTQHKARHIRAQVGTRKEDRILRLSDGTLLDSEPRPNPYSTWDWDETPFSLEAYLEGRSKPRKLSEMARDVIRHLKASVWLPNPEDYVLLALTVPVTYAQAIFDAVPLVLVNGSKNTGKSQLGTAMTKLCCNSPKPIGNISAASIARLIDQVRGFVVLDDLERAGSKSGDAQFDELKQSLKLSYNKETANKFWTNMKTGRLEKLNFYGVKMINNTLGVDEILGSRMLHIHTRSMPDGIRVETKGQLSEHMLRELRNELHTWTFMNVGRIAASYGRITPSKTDRQDEITAPLKVMAELANDHEISKFLKLGLERQVKAKKDPDSPEEILREALKEIVRKSIFESGVIQTWISITQVMMEMQILVDVNYGKNFSTEVAQIESPEWVSRHLRQNYVDPDAEQKRASMYGKSLRAYRLADGFIEKTIEMIQTTKPKSVIPVKRSTNFKAFCQNCVSCSYLNRCEIQKARMLKEMGTQH